MTTQIKEVPYKTLYENKWVDLRETEGGYVYSHESRCNGSIVAILVHDGADSVMGRFEITPAHGPDINLVSITGGVEDELPVASAVRELKEEAGIDAKIEELVSLGTVRPSKSADTVVHLFALDGSKKEVGNAEGDGSAGEEGSYCNWVSVREAAKSSDPLVAAMLLRLTLVESGDNLEKGG